MHPAPPDPLLLLELPMRLQSNVDEMSHHSDDGMLVPGEYLGYLPIWHPEEPVGQVQLD